jgi:hypothetical protein
MESRVCIASWLCDQWRKCFLGGIVQLVHY